LLVAPFVALALSAFLQVGSRALLSGNSNDVVTVVINLFSLLIGVIAVPLMLVTPLWVTLLVLAIKNNQKIDAIQADTQPQQQGS
jgi:hypothetical protein